MFDPIEHQVVFVLVGRIRIVGSVFWKVHSIRFSGIPVWFDVWFLVENDLSL
jgi:hypothetical protein